MTKPHGSEGPPRASASAHPVADPTFVLRGRQDNVPIRSPGPVPDALRQAVGRMSAVGPGAEKEYQKALDAVRAQPSPDVVQALAETMRELPEDAYLQRLTLTQVATDVADGALTDFFRTVIAAPIPPERAPGNNHGPSTRAREVLIRMAAVDGLSRLAAYESSDAKDCLLSALEHENRSIRAAAIAALRELGGEAAERMRATVPPEDRELLRRRGIRTADRPVPDVDPATGDPGIRTETPAPDRPG